MELIYNLYSLGSGLFAMGGLGLLLWVASVAGTYRASRNST